MDKVAYVLQGALAWNLPNGFQKPWLAMIVQGTILRNIFADVRTLRLIWPRFCYGEHAAASSHAADRCGYYGAEVSSGSFTCCVQQ